MRRLALLLLLAAASLLAQSGPARAASQEINSNGPELKPAAGLHAFHVGGSSRDVITQLCTAYAVSAAIDSSVRDRPVRLDLENADWETAARIVSRLTGSFWTPFSEHGALFVDDTRENRKRYEPIVERTFYLGPRITPQTLNELVSALRTMFEVQSISPDTAANTVTLRADRSTMRLAEQLLGELADAQQQLVLTVDLYQVSGTFTRSFGVTVPTQFQMFYIPTAAAGAVIVKALQSATLGSLGLTGKNLAFGLPSASINFSQSRSEVRALEEVTLRATQGTPATLHIGERYPFLTSSYSSVVPDSSFKTPMPAFSYEDIGLSVKATPTVHRDGTVSLQLDVKLNSLGGQIFNSNPVVLNSEYSGHVSARDGEPIVVAGNVLKSVSDSRSGWPGISQLPILGGFLSAPTRQLNDDEMLIVITLHIYTDYEKRSQHAMLINARP